MVEGRERKRAFFNALIAQATTSLFDSSFPRILDKLHGWKKCTMVYNGSSSKQSALKDKEKHEKVESNLVHA